MSDTGKLNYIGYAERLIRECDGTHQTDYVCAKAQLATANALMAVAVELKGIRDELRGGRR